MIGIGLRVLCEFSPVFPNDYGGRNQGSQLGQSVAWVRAQAGRDRVAQKPEEVLEEVMGLIYYPQPGTRWPSSVMQFTPENTCTSLPSGKRNMSTPFTLTQP